MDIGKITALLVMWFLQEARAQLPCKLVDNNFQYVCKVSKLETHCLTCITFEDVAQRVRQISCSSNDLGVTLEYLRNEYSNLFTYYNDDKFMITIKYGPGDIILNYGKLDSFWTGWRVLSLDLSDVLLSQHDQQYIYRFPNLIDLNLKSTSFILDTNTHLNLTKLQVLNLSYNNITTVSRSNFEHLINLFKLDLSHNEIASLPADVFAMQSHLEELVLSNNKLTNFDLPIKNISHALLPSLYLSFNRITTLQLNGFFQKLVLSHNKLSRFSVNLTSVTTSLDLSYNELTTIGAYTLANVSSLEFLDLNHNLLSNLNTIDLLSERLTTIHISDNLFTLRGSGRINNWLLLFLHSPHLKLVSLKGNLWTCSDLGDIIHILKARNVSIIPGNTYGQTNVMGIECSPTPSNDTPLDTSPWFTHHVVDNILNYIHNRTVNAYNPQQDKKLVSRMEQMEQNLEKLRLAASVKGTHSIADQIYNIIDVKLGKIKDEVMESNKDKMSMSRMEQQLMALTSKFDSHSQTIIASSKESNNGPIVIIGILVFLLVGLVIGVFYLYSRNRNVRNGVEAENVGLVNIDV